jgi:two-component system OmpR family sensor kinase
MGDQLTLRHRVVLGTAVALSLGMIALTILVQVVLALIVDRDIDGVLADRVDAVSSTVVAEGGQLKARETPTAALDQYTWIYDNAGRLVEGSVIGAPLGDEFQQLSTTASATTLDASDFRLRAAPVSVPSDVDPADVTGVVVVAEPLEPYERTERNALWVSIVLGATVVVGVTLTVAIAVRRALQPVADMSRWADEWSEHDLARRFDLGPGGDEITALGRTFDALLERVSRVIRSEQRLSSELAHELRTPLTAVRGEAELALNRPGLTPDVRNGLERIVDASGHMSETITTLMTISRNPGLLETATRLDVALATSVARLAPGQGDHVEVVLEDSLAGQLLAVPDTAMARILAPLLDNALRYKDERVHISASADDHRINVYVDDDGPGLAELLDEDVFSAGARHPESPGAGLGLALSKRLAVAVGGDVSHVPHHDRTRFVVSLPRA